MIGVLRIGMALAALLSISIQVSFANPTLDLAPMRVGKPQFEFLSPEAEQECRRALADIAAEASRLSAIGHRKVGNKPPSVLQTDRIRNKYGEPHLKIISQGTDSRRVYISTLGKDSTSEVHIVADTKFFPIQASDPRRDFLRKVLSNGHDAVLLGGSIGDTLRSHGFQIKKAPHPPEDSEFVVLFSGPNAHLRDVFQTTSTSANAHRYVLWVKPSQGWDRPDDENLAKSFLNNGYVPYAVITEIFNPSTLNTPEDSINPQLPIDELAPSFHPPSNSRAGAYLKQRPPRPLPIDQR